MNKPKSIKIPFNVPFVSSSAHRYILDSINSKFHCGNGPFAKKCIAFLKEKYSFNEVFLTPSGTDALEMGALLAGLNPGDEVVLPSYTFSSTANAIVLRGAKPVFCEIDSKTMNIDVNKIPSLITEKTKMILPIDYAGIPCEIDRILEIANQHKITVMQDAAQSLNSFTREKACGAEAPLVAFSFHETKNFTCGEGGALVVNNPEWVEKANYIQEKGTDRSLVLKGVKNKYSWVNVGSSFLMSDILAAMLYSQFEDIDYINSQRGKVVDAYYKLFNEYEQLGFVSVPKINNTSRVNNHAFFVIFDTEKNQELFLKLLKDRDVSAYIGYVPLHSSPFGRSFGYSENDLPLTEELSRKLVRLPLYVDLAQNDLLSYCIDSMTNVLLEIYKC
jgi:dTDP-4-amino-4,6-dideoxygalactose transaminase